MIDSREIANEIGVNAICCQRIGLAFVGAGFEFHAASAVQDEYGRAFPDTICRVPGHGDTTLVSVHAEFFGHSRVRREGSSKRRDTG
jgi:hypothetical protein